MHRIKYIFLILLPLTFASGCKDAGESKSAEIIHNASEMLADSFSINHFQSETETGHLQYVNDSILESFNGFNHVYQYKKSGKNEYRSFREYDVKPHTNDIPRFLKHVMPENFYFVFKEHEIKKYDSTFKLIKTYSYNHETEFLKGNYRIAFGNHTPVIYWDGKMIANYNHEGVEFFSDYYKEPSKICLGFEKDSIVKVECFFDKPPHLVYYDNNFPDSYFFDKNKLYQLYGHFDTIYIYDLVQKKLDKKHIGNKDYRLPGKYDVRKLVNGDFADSQKHYVSNFYYSAMFQNENTGHIVIFYTMPVSNKDGDFSAKKQIRAIVLNPDLTLINYVEFKQKYVPNCALNIKGKGIALPVFNPDVTDEKTVYHIYNF